MRTYLYRVRLYANNRTSFDAEMRSREIVPLRSSRAGREVFAVAMRVGEREVNNTTLRAYNQVCNNIFETKKTRFREGKNLSL